MCIAESKNVYGYGRSPSMKTSRMFISIILTGFSSQLVSVHLPLSEELTCTAFMNRIFITESRCRVLRVIAVFRVRVYRDDNNSCRCISTVEIQENTRGAALYNTLDINIYNVSTVWTKKMCDLKKMAITPLKYIIKGKSWCVLKNSALMLQDRHQTFQN